MIKTNNIKTNIITNIIIIYICYNILIHNKNTNNNILY